LSYISDEVLLILEVNVIKHARVLVISPGEGIGAFLMDALCASRFTVIDVRPGPCVVEVARKEQLHIAVIDSIHDRSDAAQLEIALLKDMHDDVQIIVMSEQSTFRDACIVEQGIFYYMAAPPGEELIRVIEAAAGVLTGRENRRQSLAKLSFRKNEL
jgi:DNA-binding NtrC family response regulator